MGLLIQDKILMEDFQHLCPVDSGDACQGRERQDEGRKNDMGKCVFEDHPISCDQTIDKEEAGDGDWRNDHRIEPSSNRKKMKPCSEKELKHDPQPEHGNGNTRNGEETGAVVNPCVSVNSGENSEEDAKDYGEANRNEHQFKRSWQKELDIFPDLVTGPNRPAKIPLQQTSHIGDVLNDEGLIQTELFSNDLDHFLGSIRTSGQFCRVTRCDP